MPAAHVRTFRDGKTLEGELAAAMHRVRGLGVTFSRTYYETLVAKYEKGWRSLPPHPDDSLGNPRSGAIFSMNGRLAGTSPDDKKCVFEFCTKKSP